MNTAYLNTGAFFLIFFSLFSAIDGLYLHLWKFKLQENPDSKTEHILHTVRALLFIPMIVGIFSFGVQGLLLWAVALVVLVDLGFETWDILIERSSRNKIGGLTSLESLLHNVLTSMRLLTLTFGFLAYPASAWDFLSNEFLTISTFSKSTVELLLPGSVLVAILHVLLIVKPYLVSSFQESLPVCCR